MLVIDDGHAVALSDSGWLEMLDAIAGGQIARATCYGAEVGQLVGDLGDLAEGGLSGIAVASPGDPFAELVVTEYGEAFALAPSDWLNLLADRLAGGRAKASAFGPSLGLIGPVISDLRPHDAADLAAQARRVGPRSPSPALYAAA